MTSPTFDTIKEVNSTLKCICALSLVLLAQQSSDHLLLLFYIFFYLSRRIGLKFIIRPTVSSSNSKVVSSKERGSTGPRPPPIKNCKCTPGPYRPTRVVKPSCGGASSGSRYQSLQNRMLTCKLYPDTRVTAMKQSSSHHNPI